MNKSGGGAGWGSPRSDYTDSYEGKSNACDRIYPETRVRGEMSDRQPWELEPERLRELCRGTVDYAPDCPCQSCQKIRTIATTAGEKARRDLAEKSAKWLQTHDKHDYELWLKEQGL